MGRRTAEDGTAEDGTAGLLRDRTDGLLNGWTEKADELPGAVASEAMAGDALMRQALARATKAPQATAIGQRLGKTVMLEWRQQVQQCVDLA